jgi:hypothetical protein
LNIELRFAHLARIRSEHFNNLTAEWVIRMREGSQTMTRQFVGLVVLLAFSLGVTVAGCSRSSPPQATPSQALLLPPQTTPAASPASSDEYLPVDPADLSFELRDAPGGSVS